MRLDYFQIISHIRAVSSYKKEVEWIKPEYYLHPITRLFAQSLLPWAGIALNGKMRVVCPYLIPSNGRRIVAYEEMDLFSPDMWFSSIVINRTALVIWMVDFLALAVLAGVSMRFMVARLARLNITQSGPIDPLTRALWSLPSISFIKAIGKIYSSIYPGASISSDLYYGLILNPLKFAASSAAFLSVLLLHHTVAKKLRTLFSHVLLSSLDAKPADSPIKLADLKQLFREKDWEVVKLFWENDLEVSQFNKFVQCLQALPKEMIALLQNNLQARRGVAELLLAPCSRVQMHAIFYAIASQDPRSQVNLFTLFGRNHLLLTKEFLYNLLNQPSEMWPDLLAHSELVRIVDKESVTREGVVASVDSTLSRLEQHYQGTEYWNLSYEETIARYRERYSKLHTSYQLSNTEVEVLEVFFGRQDIKMHKRISSILKAILCALEDGSKLAEVQKVHLEEISYDEAFLVFFREGIIDSQIAYLLDNETTENKDRRKTVKDLGYKLALTNQKSACYIGIEGRLIAALHHIHPFASVRTKLEQTAYVEQQLEEAICHWRGSDEKTSQLIDFLKIQLLQVVQKANITLGQDELSATLELLVEREEERALFRVELKKALAQWQQLSERPEALQYLSKQSKLIEAEQKIVLRLCDIKEAIHALIAPICQAHFEEAQLLGSHSSEDDEDELVRDLRDQAHTLLSQQRIELQTDDINAQIRLFIRKRRFCAQLNH